MLVGPQTHMSGPGDGLGEGSGGSGEGLGLGEGEGPGQSPPVTVTLFVPEPEKELPKSIRSIVWAIRPMAVGTRQPIHSQSLAIRRFNSWWSKSRRTGVFPNCPLRNICADRINSVLSKVKFAS